MPPPCTIAPVSPANPSLVPGSSDPPRRSASSPKRAVGKRFSPFYSIPVALPPVPSSLPSSFSFSPFSETLPRRHDECHICRFIFVCGIRSCGGARITPFLSTDAQTLFGQIKSLSRRLKIFARADFGVQFLNEQNTGSI